LLALGRIWPTILLARNEFKENKPVIEHKPVEKVVFAYPALSYINDLTDRTRDKTRGLCLAGEFLVFVRDTRKRIFRSYVFPVEEPPAGRLRRNTL
jgi:hypothetical protein